MPHRTSRFSLDPGRRRSEKLEIVDSGTKAMSDAPSQTRVMCSSTVTVRQRPSLLLMKVPLLAAEATLELGLTRLKKQCEAASRWLQRLDPLRVEFGEPHFAGQADLDPMKQLRAATRVALRQRAAKTSSRERKRDVIVVLTALWPIAGMSAEETLVFVDRLQFEAATDAGAPEPAEECPPATPEEQVQEMMAQLAEPPTVDRGPQFLFIAQLGEEPLAKATTEAFTLARQNAERLAWAMGMRLGKLGSVHHTIGGPEPGRPDKLLKGQRCAAILAGSAYDLGENEIVSDDPQSAAFTVKVNLHYQLEPIADVTSSPV
jgi:hypothetical protein